MARSVLQNCETMDFSARDVSPHAPEPPSIASDLTLGLLHEVNNVLTGIYFSVGECQEEIAPTDPACAPLNEIAEAVKNLHHLLERTIEVNLARPDDEPNYHSLDDLVSSQLDLLRIVFPKSISIGILSSKEPLHVFVRSYEFRKILLALAAFLRDAWPSSGGKLLLELTARPASFPESNAGDQVAIALRCEHPGWKFPFAVSSFLCLQAHAENLGWELTTEPALLLPRIHLGD